MSNCENNCEDCVCKEELTLEQAKGKIAELEAKLNPPQKKLTPEDLEKKKKEVAFFTELKRGGGFIKFILDDLHNGGFPRQQRRRLISQMMSKKFSMELIQIYMNRIDEVVTFLNNEVRENTPQDGADFYDQMKHVDIEGTNG